MDGTDATVSLLQEPICQPAQSGTEGLGLATLAEGAQLASELQTNVP
jgi:hypothetical protein